jgi:(2Fe-2S) ferredoxin
MKRFDKHVFICENKRAEGHPKGCCFEKGSPLVITAFKKKLKELGLNSNIRINSSGCLDACEFGVSMVVYHEQIWYGGVTVEDVDEIVEEHFLNDKPVQRLTIKDVKYNKDDI